MIVFYCEADNSKNDPLSMKHCVFKKSISEILAFSDYDYLTEFNRGPELSTLDTKLRESLMELFFLFKATIPLRYLSYYTLKYGLENSFKSTSSFINNSNSQESS